MKKMPKKYKCFLLLLILCGLIGYLFLDDHEDFKEDYYEAMNQKILEEHPLQKSDYTWSAFGEAQDQSDEKVREIVREIVDGKNGDVDLNIQKKIQTVYENAMDQENRDQVGIQPLKMYVDEIWNSQSIDEFIERAIWIEQELGIDIFTRVVVAEDYMDNQHNMVYFYPVTFSFGSSADYWVDEDYMAYEAYIKRAMIQLWKAYGYSQKEAREKVHRLVDFYQKVGSQSKLAADLEDVQAYYHVVTVQELDQVYSNINIESYLQKRKIQTSEKYSLVDEGQYRFLDQYLIEENLDLWKDFVILKILDHYAMYAGSNYQGIVNQLNLSLIGIEEEKITEEERAMNIVVDMFSDDIDSIYQKQVLSSAKREYILTMVEDVRAHYKQMLKNNVWLGENTKKLAMEKLEKMKVQVGMRDNISSLSQEYWITSFAEGGSLIDNVRSVWQANYYDDLRRLESGEKSKGLGQSIVNAYYNPLDNSISIPSAATFLFDMDWNYYENLGSIGMVISHEMTHGFDGNGSQFDSNGNLHNWWTKEDWKAFLQLQDEVSSYYSAYEVLNGKFVNGKKTVNENIADLGALSCIVGISLERGASEQELQKMFSSFAHMWASQSKDEYTELLLLQDSHAPNKYRVNAVLSSIEEFYRVYHVHFWNDMYVDKDRRVKVW